MCLTDLRFGIEIFKINRQNAYYKLLTLIRERDRETEREREIFTDDTYRFNIK